MTKFAYPKIMRAARHIATDQGDLVLESRELRSRVKAALWGFTKAQANAAERWLAKLTPKQLEMVAVGERDEQQALLKKLRAPKHVDAILDDIYEDLGF